ncbi:uncharacterized protein LOC110752531 [Prunus avium]|uniref:Uncharacterized protein LOC110752531 n=1 Tax=Prunus avium TaxID=42229 RepID=A0A6P5S547_PRUAV|nr:uncharacterized protein LOC110752531 [Prunus avium]
MGDSSGRASVFPGESDGNPNLRLCSVLLNGFNYIPWSRAVSLALGGRSKLGFINGNIPAPAVDDPKYEDWFCKDQLVMSWLLNSMEPQVAEIFSFSDSAQHLWTAVKEMYGNQNNAARIFQLKKDIAGVNQDGKSFIEHLGKLKGMWNELDLYRPHTIDSATLLKRAEEDKIFQLLASLDPNYEDLRSHILMSAEMPSFNTVCTTIQREEVRKKVMNVETKSGAGSSESKAFVAGAKKQASKNFKGKKGNLECSYCEQKGHTKDRCWILHPHLKPKFGKEGKGEQKHSANQVSAADDFEKFTTNPSAFLGEFAAYLHQKNENPNCKIDASLSNNAGANLASNSTTLLGQFANFLQQYGKTSTSDVSGSNYQEEDW